MMKKVYLTVLFLFLSYPVLAQSNYYRPGENEEKAAAQKAQTTPSSNVYANTIVVTSPDSCYDQLDKKEADEIRSNYIKPYRECMRRLDEKAVKKMSTDKGNGDKTASPAKLEENKEAKTNGE